MRQFYDNVNYQHVKKAVVRLTAEQVQSLPTTAIEVVPAPGVGYAIAGVRATVAIEWADDFDNIDANGFMQLATSAGVTSMLVLEHNDLADLLQNGADSFNFWPSDPEFNSGNDVSDVENKAIELSIDNQMASDLTNGDGSIFTLTFYYMIVKL